MKELQKTISNPAELEGVGLFSGQKVKLKFLPAETNSGITFVRVDLPAKPQIPATSDNAVTKLRRTALSKDGADVETIEHLMSAITGLGINNITIEINGGEVPGMDGSAKQFVETLSHAGIKEQSDERRKIVLEEPISIVENDTSLVAAPSENGLSISYTLEYKDTFVGLQHLAFPFDNAKYQNEISPARTFVLKKEAEALISQGLGKGANYKNTLVVNQNGVEDNELRFKDEFVRHKILDLLGDLTLLGAPLRAHVIAVKSGHSLNLRLVQKIAQSLKEKKFRDTMPEVRKNETWLDVREIHKILPHRYPMLLIDKVIELDAYKKAVGIKNVTINEPYFEGHFPGRPIMPGVLQIEAMAQLAGALLMRKSEGTKMVPVLLSLDNVKLRKTVVPGDQLRIEVEAIKIKARTGEVYTKTTVDGEMVAEANMKFMLVESE